MAARRQECSICMEIFKNPKLIPCHHSFCYKCLEDYVKVNLSNGRFNCPMCRKSVELPPEGVSAFEDKFYIDSESSETFPCDICGPKSVACSRCLDCEENLCQACCYVHEKLKMSRNHKVSDLGILEPEMKGKIRQRIFCDQHLEEEIKLVCKDCKALICFMCNAIKHKSHATETVSDAAAEVKKNIQIKMNQCSDKVRRITDSEREADALDQKINEAERKEIKALEDQRLQLIKVVDQEVAKLKDKIQNVYQDLRHQNEALKRDMKEELKMCSTANETARKIIDQGTDIDVIKKGSDLEQLLFTAMTETVKTPMTRMEKNMFSPVEIKVIELIPFIGTMRDSTEISLEEREKPLREEREKLEREEREKKEKEERERKEREERQIKEWSQKMETRVKDLEGELSSTRKQYEEAKTNAITIGAKLNKAEKEIQALRIQHADAVAEVNRYKRKIEEREKKEKEEREKALQEEREKKKKEEREKKEREERKKKEKEEREKKEREEKQIQAARQAGIYCSPRTSDEVIKRWMCAKCQGWTADWIMDYDLSFNCKCHGNK